MYIYSMYTLYSMYVCMSVYYAYSECPSYPWVANEVVTRIPCSTQEEMNSALKVTKEASPSWSNTSSGNGTYITYILII